MLEKSSASIRNFPIREFTPSVTLRRQLDLIREAAANDSQCLQEFLWAATKDFCNSTKVSACLPT
jgi:hypothetical protein